MQIKEINAQKINSIKLPSSLRKGKVFIIQDKDALTIKKIQSPTLIDIRQRLKAASGQITEEEIDQEVQKYRKGK